MVALRNDRGGTESSMSGPPTNPDDTNATARYDPPPPPETPPTPAEPPPPASSPAPPALPTPPPRWRTRDNDGRWGTIIFGGILVAVGLWFFADQTLGLDMPRLRWSELWPIFIIVLGGWIVLGSMRRDS
jgi:hypothetical protein